MYEFEITPRLEKKLAKFKKKDALTYSRIRAKIAEVAERPLHYKPLSYDLKGLRRAHIGPFVLFFYLENDIVHFVDYEHHDKAYL